MDISLSENVCDHGHSTADCDPETGHCRRSMAWHPSESEPEPGSQAAAEPAAHHHQSPTTETDKYFQTNQNISLVKLCRINFMNILFPYMFRFTYTSTMDLFINLCGFNLFSNNCIFNFWINIYDEIKMWNEILNQLTSESYLTLYLIGYKLRQFWWGGGIECPPSKILENEATESCEGSK